MSHKPKTFQMKLQIEKGTPYQILDGLLEFSEQQATSLLQLWADTRSIHEVSRNEAINMGYNDLGSWSNSEMDSLFLIDDVVLIVQNKQRLLEYNNSLGM